MNKKQLTLGAGSLVALAALALAHHVPVGLSHVSGSEILSTVVYFTTGGTFGVPAYKVGAAEAPDHGAAVGLVDGDSFTVMNEAGQSETITLEAADFTDISTADMHDVVHVLNDKASLFEAIETNGYLVLQGLSGGDTASLAVTDGLGGPLAKMGVTSGTELGADELALTISIPDPLLNLAGASYVTLISATDGSFSVQGKTIPIGFDSLTQAWLPFVRTGAAPGFKGNLDGNSDASALLTGTQFQQAFGSTSYPDKLYFAYVVFTPGTAQIAYVSNRFTVDFR
jgi:hypothetical protein